MTEIKSNINILGGYKNFDSIPQFIENGSLNLSERTEASSKRYVKAIEETFLTFEKEDHELLFKKAMSSKSISLQSKLRILALQFYTVDPLLRMLYKDCFLNIMYSGRVVVTKHDVISFIKEKVKNKELNIDWSEETVETVSRKFLTILKKLGYLEGKAKKSIKEVQNDVEFLIYFHYWLEVIGDTSNVLRSDFFPILMMTKEKYLFIMKQDEVRNSLDWQYTGNRFTVEPKLPLNEYVNEL